jgi:tetratricopeptide (TPR) repeat protein
MLPVAYFLIGVSFYLRTYDSAQIKITLTQIGCTAIIVLWLAQLIVEKRWPFRREDLPVLAPFLAFLASGVLSFAQSSFLAGSFDEFLRRVLYSFMGIIVIVEFRSWDRHRRLLRWLLAAFGVCVFYGIVQFFDTRLFPPGQGIGLDPFVWRHAFGARPFSTFGNPNFYGNFLVIITPIIMAIYLRSGGQIFRPYVVCAFMVLLVYCADRLFLGSYGGVTASTRGLVQAGLVLSFAVAMALVWWKTPTAAASGMLLFWSAMFLNLYATETKGAWLGFIGALSAASLLVAFFFASDRARRIIARVVLVTVILGIVVVGYFAQRRFQSVSFRVFTWIATWEMIREQPVLGSGIGSFKWAYPAHRRPEIILVEGKSNTETDHVEDEYLEIWYDEGIVGIGIFLWLILMTSVLGLRALSRLTRGPRGPPPVGTPENEKAWSLLAYLGAFWGALIHWFVDVSVRFVSSGTYSVLLPGLVASLVTNREMPYRQDAPSRADRWVRLGVAVFWVAVLLSFGMSLGPVLACGAALWLIGEALEVRLTPEADGEPPVEIAPEALEADVRTRAPWQLLALAGLLAAWGWGFWVFRNFFLADVNHNVAIFFSKQGVWTKSPEFDSLAAGFPPDMQREYREVGGALEHYAKVVELNPFFPMARYFIGNVHNDWGSNFHAQAMEARQRGDAETAKKLKAKAEETWGKALDTYARLKDFAPNYVQTHHQVGLVYLKLGDMEKSWGNEAKAQEHWDTALKNFALYKNLDPVFPPNYYRIAYIHFMRGDIDKAEAAYLGALDYNTKNIVQRISPERNAETYVSLGRLYYIVLTNKNAGASVLPKDAEEFKKAADYYTKALDALGDLRTVPGYDRWKFDAMKGLAILYSRANVQDKALELWQQLRAMRPDDPDVKSVFRLP